MEAENINPLIWTAIEQRRLLRFRYKDRETYCGTARLRDS